MLLGIALLPLALQLPSSSSPSIVPGSSAAPATFGRRAACHQAAAAFAAASLMPLKAQADVRGINENRPTSEKDVNKLLSKLGFSPLKVPSGFSPLVQYIGTAPPANIDGTNVKTRAFDSTLLVRFLYPSTWLVETPTITENGEAGNIGANNYIKGDSANFASLPLPKDEKLTTLGKPFFQGWLSSQMSKDVYEDVKVKKLKPVTQVCVDIYALGVRRVSAFPYDRSL